MKPDKLYHGSNYKIGETLKPLLLKDSPDHIHNKAAVFATEKIDIAAMFMFPADILHSIGFENNIAYICIWGEAQEFKDKDPGGFVYVLPVESFEKIGKEYEWQSFQEVSPLETKFYPSVISGMMENYVQVYFINDEIIFDQIVIQKNNRAPILKNIVSENEKVGINIRRFN